MILTTIRFANGEILKEGSGYEPPNIGTRYCGQVVADVRCEEVEWFDLSDRDFADMMQRGVQMTY